MTRRFLILAIIILMISGLQAQKGKLSFSTVTSELNSSKKTSLYIKNYWSKVLGEEVVWAGKVKDVKGGRGKAQILVANKNAKTYKGFNIVLTTFDEEAAAMLEIGQHIKFKGELRNYKSKKGGGVVIYLTEVELVKTKK